jgi:hypothetical protein
MDPAAHWLPPTPAFAAQTRILKVGIWIVLPSGTTDFGNQKASHYIVGSQLWSMIEWCISNACYSKQASGVLHVLSTVMRCGSCGEHSVLMMLQIVSTVGRQGKFVYGLGGFS